MSYAIAEAMRKNLAAKRVVIPPVYNGCGQVICARIEGVVESVDEATLTIRSDDGTGHRFVYETDQGLIDWIGSGGLELV